MVNTYFMKQKFKRVCGFAKLSALAGISVATLASPVLFAGADTGNAFRNASRAPGTLDSATSAARTSMRVTPDGTVAVHNVESKVAPGAETSTRTEKAPNAWVRRARSWVGPS